MSGEKKNEEVIKVVMLVRKPDLMKATCTFLNRRGIIAEVQTGLNEAIEAITQRECSFVLLSVNFAHPKIEMLPPLLSQSFNSEVIMFAETDDRKTTQKMQSMKVKHIISGFATGPTLQMKLRQIMRDRAAANAGVDPQNTRRSSGPSGENENNDVRIKSSSTEGDNSIVLKGGSRATGDIDRNKASAADRFLQALEGADLSNSPDSIEGTSGTTAENDGAASFAGNLAAEQETSVQKGKKTETLQSQQDDSRTTSGLVLPDADLNSKANSPSANTEFSGEANSQGTELGLASKANLAANHKEEAPESAAHSGYNFHSDQAPNGRQSLIDKIEEQAPIKEREALWKCVDAGLLDVFGRRYPSSTHEKNSESRLYFSNNPGFEGSFLVGIPPTTSHESEVLFNSIRTRTLFHMKRHGLQGDSENFNFITFRSDDFTHLLNALDPLSIYYTGPQSSAAGIYLYQKDYIPKLNTEFQSMISVEVDSLRADIALNFEAFIYFPVNQKFVRYLKGGSKIAQTQIDNLKKNKIKQVYIPKKDLGACQGFLAFSNIIADTESLIRANKKAA